MPPREPNIQQKEEKQMRKQEQKQKAKEDEEDRARINKQGIFGFGVSENSYLELLTIAFLACAGIIIKLCLSGSYSQSGTMGPASSTIWGYGLTAIALSIMAFIGIYLFSNKIFDKVEKKISFLTTMLSILPIVLTLFVIIYIIYLNFSYFTRINSNKVTPDYHIFSGVSSALLIVKIILISMYLFHYITKTAKSDDVSMVSMSYIENIKNITYILCTINFILLFMIHINLAVFSTDE
jgi:hypothetical protein